MRRIVPLIGLLILVFMPLSAVKAVNPPGSLDVGFDAGDGPDGTVQSVVLQSDGRILIAGNFTHVDGWGYKYAARLNANGGLDHAFNAAVDINNGVFSMDLQQDGKILIGGTFDSVGGIPRKYLARLNPDGTLDQSFDPGSWLNSSVTSIVVQPDGKILIAGNFYDFDDNSFQWGHIARLNSDGTKDSSFDPGDGANGFIDDISLMSDGKIVIGGNFSSYDGGVRKYVARLNPDGSLDEAFDPGAGPDTQVQSVAVDNQDRVLIGGLFSEVAVYERYYIARLESSGYVDTSFDPEDRLDNSVTDIEIQADGKILLIGDFTAVDGIPQRGIARLDSGGARDTGFDPGAGTNGSVKEMAIYPNGQIFIGGDFTTYRGYIRNRVARVNYDGSHDRGLYTSPGPNNTVYSIAHQTDGKVLIGGDFSLVEFTSRNGIARLKADGTLDTSFDPLQGVDGFVSKIALLPDGKIIIGGSFTKYALYDCANIALLNSNGSLVTSFCDNADTNNQVKDIVVQPDSKILIAGNFTEVNGQERIYIARLNQDGSLDSTFNPSSMRVKVGLNSLALRDDGVMYLGGRFMVNLDGMLSVDANLARLNPDGSLDSSYDPLDGPDYTVRDVALDQDDKVYIGGMFSNVGIVPRKYIARLNADGSLDEVFDPGDGPDAPVNVLAVVDSMLGVVLIGGEFQTVDGVERNYLARMHSWGAVETMFSTAFSTDPDSGFNSPVHDILPAGDGRIYVGGSFYLVGDAFRFYAASLHAGTQPGLAQTNFSVKRVGDDYTGALLSSGYPRPVINIISGNLPPGLVMDSPTGVISGTFEAAGIFTFTVTASNYISPSDTKTYTMTVNKGETSTTITSHEPQPVYVGQAVTVSYDVASTVGTPSGQVTVTEGLVSCTGTVSQGSCDLVFGWPGPMVLMAKYSGDDNFEPSNSPTIVHNVYAGIFLPLVSR